MTIPASYPLDLYRGDTVAFSVRVWADGAMTTPADLTGVTAKAQVRDTSGALVAELTCTVALPQTINVALLASAWAAAAPASAVWDLQLTYATGSVRTILAGPVRIIDDVTVAA